jgi:preprotein translocase subunit SecG
MITIVLVIHLILAVALVGVVLLQQSEGGALGIGGGGGMSGFMTGRSTANLLTRTTAILAALFFVTSITLVIMAGGRHGVSRGIALPETAPVTQPAAPPASSSAPSAPAPSAPGKTAPAPSAPAQPAAPAEPSAPLAK